MAGIYDARGRRKYLTLKESKRFAKAAKNTTARDQALCFFLLTTGVRVGEALNLKACDLDVSAGEVIVKTLKQRKEINYRRIPLPSSLIREILALKTHPRHRVWRISRSMVWRIIKRAMAEADIHGIHATCKGLRHSYGTRSVMNGVPVTTLQTLMGHKRIETTMIYLDFMGDELRRIVQSSWEVLFD